MDNLATELLNEYVRSVYVFSSLGTWFTVEFYIIHDVLYQYRNKNTTI
jgi:hypothetical protein